MKSRTLELLLAVTLLTQLCGVGLWLWQWVSEGHTNRLQLVMFALLAVTAAVLLVQVRGERRDRERAGDAGGKLPP